METKRLLQRRGCREKTPRGMRISPNGAGRGRQGSEKGKWVLALNSMSGELGEKLLARGMNSHK